MTVRDSGLPNYLATRIYVPSGLLIPVWQEALADFPDSQLVDFLEFAWPIDYSSPLIPTPTFVNNARDVDSDLHINGFIDK